MTSTFTFSWNVLDWKEDLRVWVRLNIRDNAIPVKHTFRFKWTTPIKWPLQLQKIQVPPERAYGWWKEWSLRKK